MLEYYKDEKFRRSSLRTIQQANDIIAEYQAEGLVLTLRQLYYQFVARDMLPNRQQSYDNLGKLISKARLAGLVDWDAIEDRTRFLRGRRNHVSPASAVGRLLREYSIDMWENQDYRIEVWIEKDALVGVIERVCLDNDVNFFACRGYVSQSELYQAGKRILRRATEDGQHTVVLHLGDHDPSGIDMTRDNDDRLQMFSEYNCTIERIALNMDQVVRYNPPPNPAKLTDSRVGDYMAKFGNKSWELDALEPRVLRKLVQDHIDEYKDPEAWEEREAQLSRDLAVLKAARDAM